MVEAAKMAKERGESQDNEDDEIPWGDKLPKEQEIKFKENKMNNIVNELVEQINTKEYIENEEERINKDLIIPPKQTSNNEHEMIEIPREYQNGNIFGNYFIYYFYTYQYV